MCDGDGFIQVMEDDDGIVALGGGWTCIYMGDEDGISQVKNEGEGINHGGDWT
jgi:hypothetical protein